MEWFGLYLWLRLGIIIWGFLRISAGLEMVLRGALGQMVGGDGVSVFTIFRIPCYDGNGCTVNGIGCASDDAVSLSGIGVVECTGGGACGTWILDTLGCNARYNVSNMCVRCIIGTLGCVGGINASDVQRVGVDLR